MKIYKVTLEKIAFVEAEDESQAEDYALDDYCILSDERVVGVVRATGREVREMARGGN
jgi:hypothetical protein